MNTREFSFSLAEQFRTCPSPEMAHKQKELFMIHQEQCAYCSNKDELEEMALWEELGRQIQILKPSNAVPQTPICPGELRYIDSRLARWKGHLFYHPPLVLVLDIQKKVLVAQTYHDIALAGPQDLIIVDSGDDFFIETWNTYWVKADHLSPSVGSVKPSIVDAVIKMKDDPYYFPDWAMMPRPFRKDDVRLQFRGLEQNVKDMFAYQPVMERISQWYGSIESVKQHLKNLVQDIFWNPQPKSIEEVFGFARFSNVPMAASDSSQASFPAKWMRLKNQTIQEFRMIQAVELSRQVVSEKVIISGKIFDLPENIAGSDLVCFIKTKTAEYRKPLKTEWDEKTGVFYIEAEANHHEPINLELIVIIEE